MHWFGIVLAALSLWCYPSRQRQHEQLRLQFVAAVRLGDAVKMEQLSRQGVELLPDDPTWRYNYACSLARFKDRESKALDELEKAIDLGYRDEAAIAGDSDMAVFSGVRRFDELLEYARMMKSRPLLMGPMATVNATCGFGQSLVLGEQNLGWNFDFGCFVANLKLMNGGVLGGNSGDLYMNRDAGHSVLNVAEFPGLVTVRFDASGRERGMDLNAPNTLFPYPVFGNCSRAYVAGPCWRSLPRALMTADSWQLKTMAKFYLSNQTWVFPANADVAPVGTNGDVFASIAPYWITTAGRSYSDLPYLRAALSASRAFSADVKQAAVGRGLLAPTIQTLIRKALPGVTDEAEYLTANAHPTAFPAEGVDMVRMLAMAKAMKPETIPPLAPIVVTMEPPKGPAKVRELTYASAYAWALVLRADDMQRIFYLKAMGAEEFAFVKTHGDGVEVKIERREKNVAKVTIDRHGMSPTNRVDIMVVGRNAATGWGAPSYVSFARMDAAAPYSDPILTVPANGDVKR